MLLTLLAITPRELDRLIVCIQDICRDTSRVQSVCAVILFFVLLLSTIEVGIDGIFAATSLFIHHTAKNTRPGLHQRCFPLLEALLPGTSDINHDKRAIHL